MPPNILDSVAPRAEPIPETITPANSKNQLESREFPILEKSLVQERNKIALRESKDDGRGWFTFETELIWPNIIGITLLHLGTLYALCTVQLWDYKMLTLWGLITGGIGGFGVTGGVHRLWTHRAYKAKLPLRIILLFSYLVAGENSVFNWVRDHRVHHKYSETDADPHNSHRGFFFSHVGWLMMKKHPEVLRRGKQIDMSDITSDPVLQFAEKHFSLLKLISCFILPIMIPVYCWNEEWYMTIMTQVFIRYPFTLNATWSVNSFAHFWGNRSYDESIRPAENRLVAFASMGEGWHNFHHAFPWDYKAAELGNYSLNITTMMLDFFARIGWAYDLKEASRDLVRRVTENRGDDGAAVGVLDQRPMIHVSVRYCNDNNGAKMYCLQWLIPVLLIPKPVNPALLQTHVMFMVLYLVGFFLEHRPCTICSVVFLAAVCLICYSGIGNCLFWNNNCDGVKCDVV